MSEKIREEGSHVVTSNKHVESISGDEPDQELQGYKGGAAQGVTLPGAGRPDGPSDDGGSAGPAIGGPWGGMQADGTTNTSSDEIAVVDDLGKRNPSSSLDA